MSNPPKRGRHSDLTLESSMTDSPSTSAGNKICCDNVSANSINHCKAAMIRIDIQRPDNQNDKIPVFEHESYYSNFLAAELHDLVRQIRPSWTWTATGQLSGKNVGRFQAKLGDKACALRVVREAKFGKNYCANFVRYTSYIGKPDIALEVFEPLAGGQPGDWTSTQSNAIACIEVKQALTLDDHEGNKGFQQLVSYLVTRVRPIVREQNSTNWLLHGLLLARAEGYLVVLRSKEWLDYPWECIRITHFVFNEYISGVRELLRHYLSAALDPQTTNAAQLFKRPIELTFPKYPDNAEHLAKNANVIKCKWSEVSDRFPQIGKKARSECRFSKLPLRDDMDVVLKVVSPTIYKHDDDPGKTGQILSDLEKLVLAVRDAVANDDEVSDEAKERLSALDRLYLHVDYRGECTSSRVVVTAFCGESICAIEQLATAWSNVAVRKLFFEEVCRTALDVVSELEFVHTDLRPANIVFDGIRFTIIDWENTRAIASTQTAVSGKAKTKMVDEDEGGAQQNEMDERYPDVMTTDKVVRWLVFSACQLYMCIYIIDMTALGGNPKAVEGEFRRGGGFWEYGPPLSDATHRFSEWHNERRFEELLQYLRVAGAVDNAQCRSTLEGILHCALEIDQP